MGYSKSICQKVQQGGRGVKTHDPLAEKFFKHEKRAIKYHSQNPRIMQKTLDFKGFSFYQPFGCFVVAEGGLEPPTSGL